MDDTHDYGNVPLVFTPDNEPYLGREALLTFDQAIPFSLLVSSHIATFTRQNPEGFEQRAQGLSRPLLKLSGGSVDILRDVLH